MDRASHLKAIKCTLPWLYSSMNLLWYWASSVRDGTSSILRWSKAISRFLRAYTVDKNHILS